MDLLFPLLILFMIGLLFFSSRQRRKQASQQETLQNSLNVGDVVVMTSGISGTIVDTDEERTIDVEIAPDVVTTWLRAAVREKLVADAEHVEDLDDAGEHEALLAPAGPQDSVGTGGTPSAPSTASADASATPSDPTPTSAPTVASTPTGSSVESGKSGSSVHDTEQTSSPRSS